MEKRTKVMQGENNMVSVPILIMKKRTLEIYNGGRKMIGNGRRCVYILSALFLLLFYGISFAQDSDVQKNNWLLGVIFKLETMRDKAVEDIRECESDIQKSQNTIIKSQDIIRQAQEKGNAQAEMIARQALTTAQEAKRKNEILKQEAEKRKSKVELAKASVSATLAKQLKLPEEPKESPAKDKTELTLPPYFDEGAPPVDCNKALKQLDNPNCKCLAANRAPVCSEKGKELPQEEEKTFVFYWNIAFTTEGKHYLNYGVYFGKHDSYDEAFKACQEDAKNGSRLDPSDHVQKIDCILQ